MLSFAALAFLLLQLFGLVLSASADACTEKLPTWSLKDLKIKSRDTVGNTGTASFKLTSSQTGKTEEFNCKLVANYRCTIKAASSTQLELQINMEVLHFTVDSPLTCDGKTTDHRVVAYGDFEVKCSEKSLDSEYSCSGDESLLTSVLV